MNVKKLEEKEIKAEISVCIRALIGVIHIVSVLPDVSKKRKSKKPRKKQQGTKNKKMSNKEINGLMGTYNKGLKRGKGGAWR